MDCTVILVVAMIVALLVTAWTAVVGLWVASRRTNKRVDQIESDFYEDPEEIYND